MSCPFAGLATRYTMRDERVSVRICGAVPYERDADPEDLPLPSVCFSHAAWESCAHYLRLTQRREVARRLGLPIRAGSVPDEEDLAAEVLTPMFEFPELPPEPDPGDDRTPDGAD